MRTKLFKIAGELNINVKRAAEFLHKHGIEVSEDPNTRIDDNAVELLVKEFSKDKASKSQSENLIRKNREEKHKASDAPLKGVEEVKIDVETVKGPRVLGTIDLDNMGKQAAKASVEQAAIAQDDVKVEKKKKIEAPVVETPSVDKPADKQNVNKKPHPAAQMKKETAPEKKKDEAPVKQEKISTPDKSKEKKSEEKKDADKKSPSEASSEEKPQSNVFRLNTTVQAPQLKVLGTIDLSAINQNTRPKKKTKEERRREAHANDAAGKRKRTRIGKEKVDIEKAAQAAASNERKAKQNGERGQQGGRGGNGNGRNQQAPQGGGKQQQRKHRPETTPEDTQRQVKETLERLTNKAVKKGVKWRKEKRDEMHRREHEKAEREAAESKVLKLTEFVTANDLASMMEIPVNQVIATCMNLGVMVSINQRLDADTINIVAEEFGFTTEYVSADVSEAITSEEDSEEDLLPRPPIVTVMGHVDHGKTSLLDYIRKANVIAGEAGGITQHIGAYNVSLSDGRRITFLDTPGHEAFTAMRARGAKVTDLAIIIVAADDDVMPQTKEAINHASAAGVPIVFAINKIDKPTANPDKIKEALANMNYLVEEWGGKYQSQDISAKKGIGVDELMEKVLLEAEMLDLKANPNRLAIGSVIESSLDKGRGYVATVLVQNGTLHVGDVVLAGTHYGKIKAMFNERNQRVTEAGPATPVLVLGLNGASAAGDTFNVLPTEQEAREIASKREQLQRELGLRTKKRLGLEELGRRRELNDFHELNLVVKGDVDGSVEALSDSLIKLSTPEVQVNVLHKGVGAISESDVTLAAASDAIIIGFQVRPSGAARREAEKEGVEIRLYSVIYKAIEEVKDAMEGMLSPEIKEEITGTAEVLQTYHISKVGTIAGAMVRDGKIKRSCKVRVIRDGIVIYTGELGSLKRFKDDVKEVVSGYDCGLSVQGYNDIREGDMIEGYEEIAVKKTL